MFWLARLFEDRSQSNELDGALAYGARSFLATLYSRIQVIGKKHIPRESE